MVGTARRGGPSERCKGDGARNHVETDHPELSVGLRLIDLPMGRDVDLPDSQGRGAHRFVVLVAFAGFVCCPSEVLPLLPVVDGRRAGLHPTIFLLPARGSGSSCGRVSHWSNLEEVARSGRSAAGWNVSAFAVRSTRADSQMADRLVERAPRLQMEERS